MKVRIFTVGDLIKALSKFPNTYLVDVLGADTTFKIVEMEAAYEDEPPMKPMILIVLREH